MGMRDWCRSLPSYHQAVDYECTVLSVLSRKMGTTLQSYLWASLQPTLQVGASALLCSPTSQTLALPYHPT